MRVAVSFRLEAMVWVRPARAGGAVEEHALLERQAVPGERRALPGKAQDVAGYGFERGRGQDHLLARDGGKPGHVDPGVAEDFVALERKDAGRLRSMVRSAGIAVAQRVEMDSRDRC